MRTRRNAWKLGTPWNDTLEWYAKAYAAMLAKPIAEKTSWRYLAAMHGMNSNFWRQLGYLKPDEKLPSGSEQTRYWNQCQHQSWYFLPWHRAYLHSFEEIVLDAVVALGGPKNWALPYWDYSDASNPNALKLPPAFTETYLSDGKTKNPLRVKARYGKGVVPGDESLIDRLDSHDYVGVSGGVSPGEGGPKTTFSHSGNAEGLIEAAPHDLVHGDVGGRNGLMSYPESAALDPIFWLHHSNIDRLWEVWRARDAANKNPSDAAWQNGPSGRAFAVFGPDGKDIPSRPKDVVDTKKLGYVYEDTSDPLGGASRRATRLQILARLARLVPEVGAKPMKKRVTSELLGAGGKRLALGKKAATAEIKLSPNAHERFGASFNARTLTASTPGEPDRVFLNLENIKGNEGSASFDVFLGASPKEAGTKEARVGTVSLFGVENASARGGKQGGRGLTKVLEVTKALDDLHLRGALDAGKLHVRIVPRGDVRDEDNISVGQVSLHRQSSG